MLPTIVYAEFVTSVSIPATIGANARAIRLEAGATLQEVATQCQKYGLRWSFGRVGDLERGKVQATLPTLLALAHALSELDPEGVSLSDLLETDEDLEVTEQLTIPAEERRRLLTGQRVKADLRTTLTDAHTGEKIAPTVNGALVLVKLSRTDVERKVARDLGVSIDQLEEAMAELWGASYTEERTRRAGKGSTRQRKARVGKDLRRELREALNLGDD
ncbi:MULTISPECIES: helix-turn-helix transcriptional regulator [unclassified Dietzia]|uniref:helix-turn-helix domain-containing protein n=1 Tax=unclassified Dietzia TaxID=2617939 RepID=UPI000BDEA275|nr:MULTISPECIES: helix-turn-helix transcriptional regulator [unclassified Dietzia]